MSTRRSISALLRDLSAGRREALDDLLPVVYDELQQIARRQLQNERPGHTLDSAALVNETYLRLVNIDHVQWQDRAHFVAVAARTMRRVLIDYARSRQRDKRGGKAIRISLSGADNVPCDRDDDLIALDEALTRLEALNERYARVVEYRFFAGMSLAETAAALDTSPATVKRDWTFCRAWLNRELADRDSQ